MKEADTLRYFAPLAKYFADRLYVFCAEIVACHRRANPKEIQRVGNSLRPSEILRAARQWDQSISGANNRRG
jgi:hypothetical protein